MTWTACAGIQSRSQSVSAARAELAFMLSLCWQSVCGEKTTREYSSLARSFASLLPANSQTGQKTREKMGGLQQAQAHPRPPTDAFRGLVAWFSKTVHPSFVYTWSQPKARLA